MSQGEEARYPKRDRRSVLRFLAIFLGIIALFYAISLSDWVDRNVMFPILEVNARGAAAVLEVAGVDTSVSGVIVRGEDFSVAVRRGCDPIEPIVLMGAAMIAFPTRWCRKIAGLFLGSLVMVGLNVLRIASLFLAGSARVSWFESLHEEWWPAFFIVASVSTWFLWLRVAVRTWETTHA